MNGGIRLLQDIQWKKTGLSQVAENICSDLQHARASCAIRSRHHEDPFIQILSLQQSFEHWAACKVAHYQHRTAWVRRDHARPFTLRRQGREHTQNIHTIINGSSSKKHPNTTPGTGVKSGSTSGLLWSASPDTVVSSSHSGEGWQLQWKQVKKNTPCSQAEKYLGQFIHYKHQQELRDLQIVHDFQGFRPCLLGNEILFSSASLLKPICYCKAELDTYMIAISQ